MGNNLVYDDRLKVSIGIKAFWSALIAVFILLGVLTHYSDESTSSIVYLCVSGFFVFLALALTPKRLTIDRDRICIYLYLGYKVTIPASNLQDVRLLPRRNVFISQDVPFKSSWSIPVHIIQNKGLSCVVTPSNPEEFVNNSIPLAVLNRLRN